MAYEIKLSLSHSLTALSEVPCRVGGSLTTRMRPPPPDVPPDEDDDRDDDDDCHYI